MPNADMSIATPASPQVTDLQMASPATCDVAPTLVKQLGKNWAVVGQSYATLRGITQSFTYPKGQESSLGGGISYSGEPGSFQVNGTWSQSSTSMQGFPSFHESNDWYRTEFKIGKFLRYCPALGILKKIFTVHVIGWAGGDSVLHPKQPPRTPKANCVQELAGSRWITNSTAAVEWSKGLTIPVIAFEGSAQTGYDTSAQVSFKYQVTGSLCGTHDAPGGDPRQLVAKHLQ